MYETRRREKQICYKELADAYFGKKDYKKSGELYEKIADTYFDKAYYEKASGLYEKAFFNNKEKLNGSYLKIAEVYIEVSNYDKADGYLKKAFVDDNQKLEEYYKKIADIFFQKEDYLKAAKFYAKANLKENEEKCLEKLKITDNRDGKVYKIVKIGTQWWMAENLAYKTDTGSKAYEDNESNISKYGYLYHWETANKSCPLDWRLPTEEELKTLIKDAGGYGKKAYKGLITNEDIGFKAPLYGDGKTTVTGFWSSTVKENKKAVGLFLMFGEANMGSGGKTNNFSVRCVRN